MTEPNPAPTCPVVYLTRRIPDPGLRALQAGCRLSTWPEPAPVPRDVLLREVVQAEGLVCLLSDRIDQDLLDAAPHLRAISTYAVGYDNIDVPACTRRGIPVGNTPGVLTETTADLAWALLMAAARRIPEGAAFVREGHWITWDPVLLTGMDFYGATLGVIGFGRIGQAVARRARGFNMRVLYHSRTRRPEAEAELNATYASLETLLREADFISLNANLTPDNHGLINRERLALVKPTAVLINTARGAMVDQEALYEALSTGRLWAAALDVTTPEPLPPDHPLLTLPNCLVVPHIGSASIATRARMSAMAAENLLAGLRGERMPYCVNPEVYERGAG